MAKHQGSYAHKRWFVSALVAAALLIAVFAVPSLAVSGNSTTAPMGISQKVKDVDAATTRAPTSESDDRASTTSSEPTITDSRDAHATGTTSTSDVVTTTDPPA